MRISFWCWLAWAGLVGSGCGGTASAPAVANAGANSGGGAGAPSEDAGLNNAHGRFVYASQDAVSGLPGMLSAVNIVTVTWTRDTEDITAQIAAAFAMPGLGSSAWWGGLSAYCDPGSPTCVGAPASVAAAQIGDAPAYPITDSAIVQSTRDDSFARFVRDKSKPSLTVLPAPNTASTLYVIFMPSSLDADAKGPGLQPGYAVTLDGAASCGYHSAAASGAGPNVAYVVVPRCQVAGQSNADVAIATAFREIANAVTDPFRALGQNGFQNPLAPAEGLEIGDVCVESTDRDRGIGGFSVPKFWSNISASCVP